MNRILWIVQVVLALLFLFAGVAKFMMPVDQMVQQTHLPAGFIHFIGVAEILGGLGLILPRLMRIKPVLTPIAAAGLVIIMIGATVVTAKNIGTSSAVFPFLTGALCAFVAWGRWRAVP